MCGIVGFSGGTSESALSSALASIIHRGPDDSGMFTDPTAGIGLAQARLSILELTSLGHQPMLSVDGSVVLVFNGEIFNFQELRAELEAAGHEFRGRSDTEVVLELYRAFGEGMLGRMNGMFALALWDARKQAMLIARDAMGVKPLYYCAGDSGFGFSSEIKALHHVFPDITELDHAALHRYLSFLWCPGEGTPFRDVRKVGPGEAIWVRQGRVERRFTWFRLPTFGTRAARLTKAEALAGTVTHLRQAVHRQMTADVPVGAFLSGGLDSSSVVAFAREINPDIRCFTIDAGGSGEDGMTDDLPFARRVAAHLEVPLDVVRVDSSRMAEDLEAMVAQLDEPLADPAPLNVLYISRLARTHGIKVLLSGAGGDDLFTGYRRHLAVKFERSWDWLPASLLRRVAQRSHRLDQRRPVFRRVRKLLSAVGLERDARLVNYFLWASREDLLPLYTTEFRKRLGDEAAEDPMLGFLADLPETIPPLERMLTLEQRFFLADHNLLYTDKMSMAAGVEVRVPFLDLELVEFADRIPARLKQRGRVGKWVLKKAMEPYLPADVIYRPKTGFGAPLRRWIRFELRELLMDLLSESSLKRRGLFDFAAVQRLIAANDAGKVDASYTLLSLMCIEIWCRSFVDRRVTEVAL